MLHTPHAQHSHSHSHSHPLTKYTHHTHHPRASRAITFIDNHDTGSTLNHWPFPSQHLQVRGRGLGVGAAANRGVAYGSVWLRAVGSLATCDGGMWWRYPIGHTHPTHTHVQNAMPRHHTQSSPSPSSSLTHQLNTPTTTQHTPPTPPRSNPTPQQEGYAYILLHPGTPCVFVDHISGDGKLRKVRRGWGRLVDGGVGGWGVDVHLRSDSASPAPRRG
jgi:hypothetical protein